MSTYGLDDKNILKLDQGATNVLTILPGGDVGDKVVIKPDLPVAGAPGGDIMYRTSTRGYLANVALADPPFVTFVNGVLTANDHVGMVKNVSAVQSFRFGPGVVCRNGFTLANGGGSGGNHITKNSGGRTCFLPGGDWSSRPPGESQSTNDLPIECDSFQFLTIRADMENVGGDPSQDVYVPCYYNI